MRILILTALAVMMTGSAWAETSVLSNNKIIGHCLSTPQVKVGDRETVLKTIAMESASKPEGMKYVAITLANRARLRGTTMSIEAKRAYQYSCWNGGGKWARAWLASYWGSKTRLGAINALSEGVVMSLKAQNRGIRHYHTIGTSPYWAKGKTPALILGGHKWYRGIA